VPPLSPDSIVRAFGPVPSHLYVLGERAGKKENDWGVPFVGSAGQTLREWYDRAKLDLDNFRRWNVCIDYKPDNPKPLGWEIKRDRLEVETDIIRCQPNGSWRLASTPQSGASDVELNSAPYMAASSRYR